MKTSRRDFLKLSNQALLGISAALGLGGLLRYLNYQPPAPPPQRYPAGNQKDFLPGDRLHLPEIPALLIHTPDGFIALSLVCPHLGCVVEEEGQEILCPCHGSRYSLTGDLLQGPSTQSLPRLPVEMDSQGNLFILKG